MSTPGSYSLGKSNQSFSSDQMSVTNKFSSSDQVSVTNQSSSSDQVSVTNQSSSSDQMSVTNQSSSSDQVSVTNQSSSSSDQVTVTNQSSSSGQSFSSTLLSSDTSSKPRAQYMTKSRKLAAKNLNKKEKCEKFRLAFKAMQEKKFLTVRGCAKFYNVPSSTLHRLIKSGFSDYKGSRKYSSVLSQEEEASIIAHVTWRQEIGCGLSFEQLGLLLQEVFIGLKEANSSRMTGFETSNQLPHTNWVRRFAERNSICLRRTVEISKGRQILTSQDLDLWQQDTENYLLSNPVLAECFKDPSRLFNQDESSIELGSSSRRVLAKKGTKVIYHVSSGSREHITVSFACNAAGGMVPPRVIYKGVRNIAPSQLNLPEDGLSGKWTFSVAPKGYITRPLFVEVLQDINNYVEKNQIQKPVVIILDGASPHLSLEAAAYCKANQIQPWLLRPNMTHLTQPLDLVFFADLKKTLKKFAWTWQTDPKNTGQFLNKYSVIGLLQEVTEACLNKAGIVQNGFKRAGLYPWDRAAPDRSKLLPGTVFEAGQVQTNNDLAENTDLSETPIPVLDDVPPTSFHTSEMPEPPCEDISDFVPLDEPFLPEHESTSTQERYEDLSSPTDTSESFEPSLSSTLNSVSVTPKTFVCESCSRRILERFRTIHLGSCLNADPQQTDDSTKENNSPPSKLSSVPTFTLEERQTMLTKFEVLLLNPKQVLEFNAQYEDRHLVHAEPLFSAWLTLKLATIPSEKEALDEVLKSHEATNVPKRKNKRKQNVPSGPTRFDPSSQDWIDILEESSQATAAKKLKSLDKTSKQKPKQKPKQKTSKKPIRS